MDGFFRRLQEVADLPNQRGGPAPHVQSSEGRSSAEDMSREELVEALAAAETRLAAAEARAEALRLEATEINDQYAAYKVKVNTWREQMKAARAQDRKTIDALRQAAATIEGATTPTVDASYVASLEEQVTMLKETVCRHAAQRDELQVELDRLKDRAKRELQAHTVAVSPTASCSESVPQEDPSATTSKYALLVAQLEKDAAVWSEKYATLERAHEALTADLDRANAALAQTSTEHAKQLREAQKSATAQYVKDLENELAAYRKQLADSQAEVAQLRSVSAVADDQTVRTAGTLDSTPQPQRQIAELEQLVTKLTAELDVSTAELHAAHGQIRELEVEGALREENLATVFAETKMLRERVEVQRRELDSKEETISRLESLCREREDSAADANAHLNEVQMALAQLQRNCNKLQRDLNDKAEQLRQHKLHEIQMRRDDHSVTVAAPAPDAPNSVDVTPDTIIATRMALSSSARYRNVALFGRQIWSSAQLRRYAAASVVLLLMLSMFTFSQGVAISQDDATAELLRRCSELRRALQRDEKTTTAK